MIYAVMISIRPKWCEKIISGKKTVEVRKNRPKLETPFKCYIYCTMDHPYISMSCGKLDKLNYRTNTVGRCNGKVIGEFVCDRIFPIDVLDNGSIRNWNYEHMDQACLSYEDLAAYIGGVGKRGFGWHISDPKIYDTPKELSEFKGLCKVESNCCACPYYNYIKMNCDGRTIKRPPQSWCYVENMEG